MDIQWPEKPTCHQREWRGDKAQWRDPQPLREPEGQPYRTCSYCGSMHPEDLLHALEHGATLGGADWKGGPHKFYVYGIPNPLAGQDVQIGSRSWADDDGTPHQEPIRGIASDTVLAKWYNQHLLELSEEAFTALAPLLSGKSGIAWEWNEGNVRYRAPYPGYQHS